MTRALVVLTIVLSAAAANAQFQMPDMKQMSGIPRPVTDLPDHAISVRLIRGDLSNNITGHPVELRVGGKTMTAKTDESGRAEFKDLPPGAPIKASADVDGEHLESQEFPAPDRGGIRLMLVATDKTKGPATTPDAPAITGQVVITNQSRIVLQPADENVEVFYLLDIENSARAPVNPTTPFVFDMPDDATGTTLMEGSTPLASVKGRRVTVAAPIPPGHHFLQVAAALRAPSGEIQIAQKFPANLESLAVVVKKVGETTLVSPQIANQREMPADGDTYIAGTGGAVAAGQPVSIIVSGVPHHSRAGRFIALTLAAGIILLGIWAGGGRPEADGSARAAERKRLHQRRDKLLNELVKLETDRRAGRVDDRRYGARREELVASLEHVYGALDGDDTAGLAA
ncbi:MAG TPA: hypothetical protein VKH42_02460 [Vicinamibacterales bacterium]|nr:hypothetical protein [Vicinamibacterales bacterium]